MADTFAFGELSAGAKEKALEAHREQLDYTWWDSIYEDAARIGGLLGIEIEQGTSRTVRGESALQLKINFSGFSSQGDGCSWSGTLWIENFEHAVAKIAEDAPNDTELEMLARRAEEIFGMVTAVHVANRLNPPDPESDSDEHYADCYPTVKISIEGKSHCGFSTVIKGGHYDLPIATEKALDQFCEDFASWIYIQLEQEYEYLTSDEQTLEHINANEMMFYEDGSDV